MIRLSPLAFLVLVACSPDPLVGPSGDPAAGAPAESAVQASPVAPGPAVPVPATAERPTLAVDGEGLRWFLGTNGSARPIAFGVREADVLASLEGVRGPAEKGTNQDCGAGPVQYASWPDGLSIVFQNGRFVGWGLNRRASGALATTNGVGPGMTRQALAALFDAVTFRDTSLGVEFAAGDIFGLLDGAGPKAKITDIWAGVSCVAR